MIWVLLTRIQSAGGRWYEDDIVLPTPNPSVEIQDDLTAFMREAIVPISVVDSYPGGVVGYWHARIGECTALAYMALDHVAAPGTSIQVGAYVVTDPFYSHLR